MQDGGNELEGAEDPDLLRGGKISMGWRDTMRGRGRGLSGVGSVRRSVVHWLVEDLYVKFAGEAIAAAGEWNGVRRDVVILNVPAEEKRR